MHQAVNVIDTILTPEYIEALAESVRENPSTLTHHFTSNFAKRSRHDALQSSNVSRY